MHPTRGPATTEAKRCRLRAVLQPELVDSLETLSGTFDGADFGVGRVESDESGARACFVVPQTGEELCTAL